MTRYEHRQRGTAIVLACLAGAAGLIAWSVFLPAPIGMVITVVGILIACAVCFSSLTIRVTDRHLSWFFGPGIFRKEVPLAAIRTAESLRIPVLYGWGIHRTPRGWLYNVSGRQAVVVTLDSGRAVLLGTDEPDRLQGVLTSD